MSRKIPRILVVSDLRSLEQPWAAWLAELAREGIDGFVLREKDLADRELLELARTARALLPPSTAVLVNGRLDVALAAGCEGAHLPADGVPIAALRLRFPGDGTDAPLLGRSTHHPAEVEAARQEGADYITFGPVYPTPSKMAYGPPPGLAGLRRAVDCGLLVLALGGVDASRLEEVAEAGAYGVAGIRVFQSPGPRQELIAAARRVWG